MRNLLVIAFLGCTLHSFAQDKKYVQYLVDSLCSETFAGRGYVNSGLQKAADFITFQMDSLGLQTLGSERLQFFKHPVNVFNGNCSVNIGVVALEPGIDFLMHAESPSFSGTFSIQTVDSAQIENPSTLNLAPNTAVLVSPVSVKNPDLQSKRMELIKELSQHTVVINPLPKLTWTVGTKQMAFPIIEVLDTLLNWTEQSEISVNITAELIPQFESQNVIALAKAQKKSKKYIVFTAHYDHLGKMGDALFPGANDNASGTAVMLDYARYYVKNPLKKYNIVFIAFAGEEAGLVGSKHFAEMPLLDLNSIRFLINLDLLGNGDDGITVVNGKLLEKDFSRLMAINTKQNLLEKVRARGEAANSDHYWFTKQGVPSFFIYTHGERNAYHDVQDVPETLHFYNYENIHQLILQFIESL